MPRKKSHSTHSFASGQSSRLIASATSEVAPNIQPLVKLVTHEVYEQFERTNEEQKEDEFHVNDLSHHDSTIDPTTHRLVIEGVIQSSIDWPNTNSHFQRVESLYRHSSLNGIPIQTESNRIIQQLQHIIDPTKYQPVSQENGTHQVPLPRPIQPPSPTIAAAADSSTASYHSLFTPLPSYDTLDDSCNILIDASSTLRSKQSALETVLELGASDLLGCPQWEQLLPAIAACLTAQVISPESKSTDKKKKRPTSPKHDHHADDTIQRYLLAAHAARSLGELYEASEASPQAAQIILAVIPAMKSLISALTTLNSSSPTNGLQWLSTLPLPSSREMSLNGLDTAPPLLLVNTIFFHLARLLTHGLHTLTETWIYYDVDIIYRLHNETFELFSASLLQPPSPVIFLLLTMPDTRLSWLRRWTSQICGRRGWHEAVIRHGSKAFEEAWRIVRDAFGSYGTPTSDSSSNSQMPSTALPNILSLTNSDIHMLACTSAWSFIVEHATSLITFSSTDSMISASDPSASNSIPPPRSRASSSIVHQSSHKSSSIKSHVSHSHKGGRKSPTNKRTTIASSTTNSSPKNTRPNQFDFDLSSSVQSQQHLRDMCSQFAFHALSHLAITIPPVRMSPLMERARLTFLSQTQYLIDHIIQRSETMVVPICTHLLTSFEVIRNPSSTLATKLIDSNHSYLSVWRTSSAYNLVHPSRSQDEINNNQYQQQASKKNGYETNGRLPSTATRDFDQPITANTMELTLTQQSALTAIIAICTACIHQHPQSRHRLFEDVTLSLPSHSSSPSTSLTFFELVGRWLLLDGGELSRNDKRFRFVSDLNPPNPEKMSLNLPIVLEHMMLDLIHESVTFECVNRHPSIDHINYLKPLGHRIDQLIQALPTNQRSGARASTHEMCVPSHQQSEQITSLMDLWFDWASHTNSLDILRQSNPQLFAYSCQRFSQLIHTSAEHITCLPWCRVCTHITKSLSTTSISPKHVSHLHRQLHRLLESEVTFLGLVRAGLIHRIFDSLVERMREEDETWSLPFELDEEDEMQSHESVIEAREGLSYLPVFQCHLWSLRMLMTILDSRWCIQLMDGEISLLTSSPSTLSVASFPTAPRPPIALLLSHIINGWILQLQFHDESTTESGATHPTHMQLPIRLPMSFPLSSSSPSSLKIISSSSLHSLPSSWFDLFRSSSTYVSSGSLDAQEIGLRLFCHLARSRSHSVAYRTRIDQWWKLKDQLIAQQHQSAITTSSESPSNDSSNHPSSNTTTSTILPTHIIDQTTKWRTMLLAALQ